MPYGVSEARFISPVAVAIACSKNVWGGRSQKACEAPGWRGGQRPVFLADLNDGAVTRKDIDHSVKFGGQEPAAPYGPIATVTGAPTSWMVCRGAGLPVFRSCAFWVNSTTLSPS